MKLQPSRTLICVPVYNRPQYLRQCIEGLKSMPEVSSGEVSVLFAVDFSDIQGVMTDICNSSEIPSKEVLTHPEHLGLGRALIGIREWVLGPGSELDCDAIALVEDDYVCGPDYLAVMVNLYNWGCSNGFKLAAVSCEINCTWPVDIKKQRRGWCADHKGCYVNYLMTRNAWGQIRPTLMEYKDKFLVGRRYQERDNNAIRSWFVEKAADLPSRNKAVDSNHQYDFQDGWIDRCRQGGDFPTGQDACTELAIRRAGLGRLTLSVNRGLFIGAEGTHTYPEWFEKRGFGQMTLDTFEADRQSPESFELHI